MSSHLTALPDEVIQTILSYLPPSTTLSLGQTCKRFVDVTSEPLQWKEYCQTSFRWWHRQHSIKSKFQDPSYIDWKPLFARRHTSSQATRNAINRIVADELGRLDWIKVILDAGYDAKDDLLDMFWNASSSENHLAQKVTAVEEWLDLKSGRDYFDSFEKPLAALDLFILEEQTTGDTDDISARLDSYVASVRKAHPAIDDLSPREKAVTVADHLLKNNWIGIHNDRHYHSLDHMFLGVALFSGSRNSVPLISAVIYCYVARQFNLRAAPCNYPFHVHAMVQPPAGIDLDGNTLPESESGNTDPSKLTHLYMDPFNSSEPVALSTLERNLNFVAPTSSPAQKASYLSAATPRDLTIRAAHNILSSPSQYAGPPVHPINPNLATYAALFSLVFLARSTANPPDQLRQHLVVLTQHFLEYFDLDIHLFETYVLPLTISQPDARAYRNLIHQLKDSDHESRPQKHRSDARNAVVKFNVGQVFRHRRRHYLAVIYGWDPYCRMQEQWITMNQVDRLPNGRNQPFYNVLVEDESTRYVAEENVVLLSPSEITEDMLEAFPIEIGKWFKRYDPQTGTFISNVRHEYPDD
ncbi:hypothetical protein LTR10_014388 [Elasticomyces elasticus]|uniref:F-box domain-containing protein n=1 Tax=Exophiala sideris TaxID=1016849 RepID=A0ABR0J0U7_9EURO|nr:hypothetical protein LTR10_014388 [Elasticomyces elasticus]KAK5023699.1 hypothetical protein LTS07_009207 [Exophiala sideris]KAK5029699.1 hypothetical protein LTR13_008619 [Exophiala sideris]KAK5053488.1 hypothetical protein LTR69_009446 [Exophiala sideris]KAK5179246.1 hypothetical protein LTR44_008400 [Eurotiomycetes sp. CCFEE 6388]